MVVELVAVINVPAYPSFDCLEPFRTEIDSFEDVEKSTNPHNYEKDGQKDRKYGHDQGRYKHDCPIDNAYCYDPNKEVPQTSHDEIPTSDGLINLEFPAVEYGIIPAAIAERKVRLISLQFPFHLFLLFLQLRYLFV